MRTSIAAIVMLAGCAPKGGSVLSGETGIPGIDGPQDVIDTCEDLAAELLTETYEVRFDATTGGCPWGEGGNLAAEQGFLTARVEQETFIDITGKVLCDMAFDFSGEADVAQRIIYDDNFVFLYNGVVLASSYRPWIDVLPDDGLFKVWDWSAVAGMENLFDEGIPTYCAGEDAGMATCDIPPPETRGPISLSFDLGITSELSYRAIEAGRAGFTFITTGDNDEGVDCSHRPFSFTVQVPYLPG